MERAFRPLAVELGWIVFEWNRLHESMGELFADLLFPLDRDVAFAIWHSNPNDRAQRRLLGHTLDAIKEISFPSLRQDIKWLLGELDDEANRRDDAIHAPLIFVNHAADGGFDVHIEPSDQTYSPRALGLLKRSHPPLQQFMWYRDHLAKLASFAGHLHSAIIFSDRDPPFPWPDKPALPPVGQYQSRAAQSGAKSKK